MDFHQIAKAVAEVIIAEGREDGFDTFKEMCECYWWESSDIQEYVESIVDELYKDSDIYLDEIDHDLIIQGNDIPYRRFIAAIRRNLRELGF